MAGFYNPSEPETAGLEWLIDAELTSVVLDSATKAFGHYFPGAASKMSQSIAAYASAISGQGVFGCAVYSAPYVEAVPQSLEIKYAGTDTGSDFTSPTNGNAAWLTQAGGAATYASVSPGVADTTYLRNVNQVEGPTPARCMMRGAASVNTGSLAGKRILSVEVHVVIKSTLATAPIIAGNLNIGGTDYTAENAAVKTNVGYTDMRVGYWELNPSTGLPWRLEDVNNILVSGATDEFGFVATWNASYTSSYADTIRVSSVYLVVRTQPEDRLGYAAGTVTATGWQTWTAKSVPNLLSKQDANGESDTAATGSWVADSNTTLTNDTDDPGAPWTRSFKTLSGAAGAFGMKTGYYPCIAGKTYAFRCYAKVTSGRTTVLSLEFYDANGNLLQTSSSSGDTGTGSYKAIGMTAVATAPTGATQMKAHLVTTATAGSQTCFAAGLFVGLDQAAINFVRDTYPGALTKIKVDGATEVSEIARGLDELVVFRRISGTGLMSMPRIPAGASAVGMPLGQESRASTTLQDGAGAILDIGDAATPVTAVVSTSLSTWDSVEGPQADYSQPYAAKVAGNVYTGNTLEADVSLLTAETYEAIRLVVAGQVDEPAEDLVLKFKRRSDGAQFGDDAVIEPTDLVQIIPPAGSVASRTTPQVFVVGIPNPDAAAVDIGHDTFDRSNNASSLGSADTGQAWTAGAGTWGINGNQAYRPTSAASVDVAVVGSPGAANGWAEMTLGTTAEDSQALAFRYVDASNFLYLARVSAFGVWNLYEHVAGSSEFLDNFAGATAAGTTIRAVYTGDDIFVYANGIYIGTYSTSRFATTGASVGIAAASTVTNAARWNGFRWGSQHYVEASCAADAGEGWTLYALDNLGATGGGVSADEIIFGAGYDAWTNPADGGRNAHRNAMLSLQTAPAAPDNVAASVVGDHIALTWTGTGGTVEVWRSNDRVGLDTDGYVQIRDLADGTLSFDDFEARRGVDATYRVRFRRDDGALSDFSTATTPVATSATDARYWFVSNSVAASWVVKALDVNDAATWEPPDQGVEKEFAGRDGAVAFLPLEDPLDLWERELLFHYTGNAPTHPGRAAFTPLERLCRTPLPYVCVLDAAGNRWFARVSVKTLRRVSPGTTYYATVRVRELTRTPST